MKKSITILALFFFTSSFACSCIFSKFSLKDYERANFIVKGEAINVQIDKERRQKKITFKIKETFKGKVIGTVTIYTALDGAACGVGVNKNDKWLLFIYNYNDINTISLCSKNVRYNKRPNQDRKSYKQNCKKLKSYTKKLKSYKNE